MDIKELLDLIKDDDLGLLDLESKSTPTTPEDRLLESFKEINSFFEEHNVEPKLGGDIQEHKLASRLKYIRENNEQKLALSKYDIHKLLLSEFKDLETLSDILSDDDLDLLTLDDSSVFHIKHLPKSQVKNRAEFIARREPSKDFHLFEKLFIKCQENLKSGEFNLRLFRHGDIKEGKFFVLDGILLFVDSIQMDSDRDGYGKEDGRLRCIFENGTESRMKYRSLQKSLEINGRTIVDGNGSISINEEISENDSQTGYIYILKSLNPDPKIASIKNLYKIGFSTLNVEDRIKNAPQDPTYLMAPVSIVATYRSFNMNPQRFERLIHRFFSEVCLDLIITDKSGNNYTPKEWFIAPINVIEKAIELIISGDVINYKYDNEEEIIVNKSDEKLS